MTEVVHYHSLFEYRVCIVSTQWIVVVYRSCWTEGYVRFAHVWQKLGINISKIIIMQIPVQPNYSVKSTSSIIHSQTARRRAGGTIGRYAATILSALRRAVWLWKLVSTYLQSWKHWSPCGVWVSSNTGPVPSSSTHIYLTPIELGLTGL